MPFDEWLAWVRSESAISTKQGYERWCKQHPDQRKSRGIPFNPAYTYADFPGWRAVLNKNESSFGLKPTAYAPFAEVRRWARSLRLSKVEAWRSHAKEHRAELAAKKYPAAPDRVAAYRMNWRGWRDFLGTDRRPVGNFKQ